MTTVDHNNPAWLAAQAFLARRHELLIDGRWSPAAAERTFPVIDPATGATIAHVAEGDGEDIDRAVKAARQAFDNGPWTTITASDRTKMMWKLAEILEDSLEEIALIETLDSGKPLSASKGDVARAAEKLRYCAGWTTKLNGETMDSALPPGWHGYTVREPIGVAGLIVPWNFPLAMAVNKIAPALAVGCTMVLKPAEQTPLSTLRLGELIQQAGFPDGVVNIVTGFGSTAGAAIAAHDGVDKVSFTGSTDVGKMIVKASAGNLKRLSLELGGKSPVFVFSDADLDETIAGAAQFIFGNTGQNCGAGSRLYAHESVFDEVVSGIADRARNLRIGSGLEDQTQIGPIISDRQLDRVLGYIDAGRKAGANVITGGNRVNREGYFVTPTVLTGTTRDMSVWREEIFGPVLCTTRFSDEDLDQLAAQANDTNYGLGAYVWTRDIGTAHKMARKIKSGFVRVNGGAHHNVLPFGGYKQSGWGRENGREGIELFTELKSVVVGL